MSSHKIKEFLLAMLIGPLIFTSCHKTENKTALEAFPVKVQPAEVRTLEDILVVSGTLKARNEAILYSRVPGKLKDNLLKEGDPVKKDQAVALVERDEVGVTFEAAPVPSTLTGTVGRIYLDHGMQVGLNTPVAMVVDDSEIRAIAEIPEKYAAKVLLQQMVQLRLEAYPDRIFHGRVSKVSPVVSPDTRTAPIEVALANPRRELKSGMFAELAIAMERKKNVLAVPAAAVTDGSGDVVFVVENGKAAKRDVAVGMRTKEYLEIKKGLEKGAAVITSGLFAIQDGSLVEVVSDEEDQP